jgi:ATP-dependent Clp protease ATP-binding subunit ClpX
MTHEYKCGHCQHTTSEVHSMVRLANGTHVCDECTKDIARSMGLMPDETPAPVVVTGRRTPKNIVSFLSEHVIGQQDAKETMALAVYNHYKRLSNLDAGGEEIDKSNILLLGPTGTGKTLLAKTVARMLDVPFTIADATSLTQAGYVGDDVETILLGLIQAADGDIAKAERGIVFIDEIDKIAKAGAGTSISRDVSGEGVQQSLLKIVEGTKVKIPASGTRKIPGNNTDTIDTKNILFICGGAFVSLLDKIHKPEVKNGIGFMSSSSQEEVSTQVTPEKVIEFGMIPEFVGRFPVIATLNPLTMEDIERVLVEPKNSVVRQMCQLEFEEGALRALAEKGIAMKTGARGARAQLEQVLKPVMMEVPEGGPCVARVKSDLSTEIQRIEKMVG